MNLARPLRERPGATGPLTLLAALLCATLSGLSVGMLVHRLRTPAPAPLPAAVAGTPGAAESAGSGFHGEATWASGAHPAPPIVGLRDQHGATFSLAALHGGPVALAFMDSHCTAECPLEGRALAVAERQLPARDRPVVVVVSVNPADTAASVTAAARRWGLAGAGSWHWLMGRRGTLSRAWGAYRIYVAPRPVDGDIAHTEALLLVDRRGDERSAYLWPFVPRFVTADLRRLAG